MYNLLEILWRGHTHWTMFLVGGLCFHLIGLIQSIGREWRLITKCVLCALVITLVEYVSGCLINLYLQLNVWDYSHFRLHLQGQICLLYTLLWGGLSLPAMWVYDRGYRLLSRHPSLIASLRIRIKSLKAAK